MKNRSVGLMVVLMLFTFGIYPIVWYVKFHGELRRTTNEGCGAILHILLTLFTFGIYYMYWHYVASVRLIRAGAVGVSPAMNLILAFFTGGLIPAILKQQAANSIATA